MQMRFPIFRLFGGALLLLAGIFGYYGITFGYSAALVFVLGGVAVLAIALSGHRPHGWDIAIFIIGILAFSGVAAGYSSGPQLTTYAATRAQVNASAISLSVSSAAGSVSVGFGNRADLAYQVNFSRPFGFSLFPGPPGVDSVTNSTDGGTFNLKVSSTGSGVSVLLGRGYSVDLEVTTDTGSVSLAAAGNESLHNVSLSAATGSVSAVVDSSAIHSLLMHTETGSVNLVSDRLGAVGPMIPVTLETSTGSVNLKANIQSNVAVSLTASTALGSVSHSLSGLTVTQDTRTNLAASTGSINAASKSFEIAATTSLGSVDITLKFLPA